MGYFNVLNYQGGKSGLGGFLYKNIEPYIQEGKAILDIFSGSAAVASMFGDSNLIYANDVENYASVIADAVLNKKEFPTNFLCCFKAAYITTFPHVAGAVEKYLCQERKIIDAGNHQKILALYESYPTVWNNRYSEITHGPLLVTGLRKSDNYHLFTAYYAASYFGIKQALDVDCIIKIITRDFPQYKCALLTCLFFAMKEAVFSKDGHMAQPLSMNKYPKRLFSQRGKNIFSLFCRKVEEYAEMPPAKFSGKNIVFNHDFEELLKDNLFSRIGLVYADPPYTDMQYSRYYHLLNIAVKYDYPDLTISRGGYTKGLYTEGRYQSKLSQTSSAKKSLEKLINFCSHTNVNLVLSYAYPKDRDVQPTDRYTISIDALIALAKKHYTTARVEIVSRDYNHANHRNSEQKKVVEYLILCGKKNLHQVNISALKKKLTELTPTKSNPLYNSHIYWSQKPYNVCDLLIEALSNKGDVVFDPFLGSGVTALEAIQSSSSRCAVGCDINDLPLFIPNLLLSINSINDLGEKLKLFSHKLDFLLNRYETKCTECGSKSIITKVRFDKPERTVSEIIIKDIDYVCPTCGKHSKKADWTDYKDMCFVPEIKNIGSTGLLPNSKLAVSENDDIRNIFTGRNLGILDEILGVIAEFEDDYRPLLKYILMSVLHLCKITDTHSNSQWPLWIPKTDCIEKNIVHILKKKINKFDDVISYMKACYSESSTTNSYGALAPGKCLLLKKGAQHITEEDIPDNGVDLIITDPPYMGQVLYSEYMQLYKPFLGLDYNLEDEVVVSTAPSRFKDKNKNAYFDLLDKIFQMCSRKLKTGRYLCLYFHDSDLTVWNKLISLLEKNCFKFITQVHFGKTVTLKNILSPRKSLNGDSVLIFTKSNIPVSHDASENIAEIEHNIICQARHMVKSQGPLTTPELYDNGLMEILIQNGWLPKLAANHQSLLDLFDKHLIWDASLGRWRITERT